VPAGFLLLRFFREKHIMKGFHKVKWFGLLKGRTGADASKLSQADHERQLLKKIKDMCAITKESAENAGLNPHGEESKKDKQRFDSAKRVSMQLAMKISDAEYRDDALVQIIELCMKANDLKIGIKLIRSIHSKTIRERLLKEYAVEFY
jgi:hypothetical protein